MPRLENERPYMVALQVYLASASPPVRFPNVYGVDLPTRREFVACDLSEEQIRDVLGADGLLYQSMADMETVGRALNPSISHFEDSCFTGDPPPCLTGMVHADHSCKMQLKEKWCAALFSHPSPARWGCVCRLLL